ncbi:hypothetical protein V6R86_08225 [Sphingomonas kaistensis]|uniref:Helix-turn-helix domain-containing protein n=1 Tax=Sphingomonas kaistensis TaxID=298708 RepID=A0ABZ2G3H8_9SPHN
MDKHCIDRLFDPTFNSCESEEEFALAFAIQGRLADLLKKGGAHRGPQPRDRHTNLRRQAAERDADQRLRDQHERRAEAVHVFEDDDDPALDHVRAEVPADVRIDGWTANRRILFLELLEERGSILAAARAVGMSRRSVYRLLPRAPAFAAAFEAAMSRVAATLADTLFDRALHGHEVPVMHGGDVVATRTVHHDMLGLHLLRMRDPLNYASPGEGERWLAGSGLKPIAQMPSRPALPEPAQTPATGDLCDLVQETPDHEPSSSSRTPTQDPASSSSPPPDQANTPSHRRQHRQPRRAPAAARTAQPPLGGLQRAGSEGGDRLGPAHRPRRGAVQAVEPDARPEPHEVPHHPDMLGRHESDL